jgi:FtsP/CotA-like multicopper oxidase with cupredoxin domain
MFRILNASATETIELALPGHEFYVVALDGNPVPRPSKVKVLQLGSAERADAIVEMKNPGVWILGTPMDVRAGPLGPRMPIFRTISRKIVAIVDFPYLPPAGVTKTGEVDEVGNPALWRAPVQIGCQMIRCGL